MRIHFVSIVKASPCPVPNQVRESPSKRISATILLLRPFVKNESLAVDLRENLTGAWCCANACAIKNIKINLLNDNNMVYCLTIIICHILSRKPPSKRSSSVVSSFPQNQTVSIYRNFKSINTIISCRISTCEIWWI